MTQGAATRWGNELTTRARPPNILPGKSISPKRGPARWEGDDPRAGRDGAARRRCGTGPTEARRGRLPVTYIVRRARPVSLVASGKTSQQGAGSRLRALELAGFRLPTEAGPVSHSRADRNETGSPSTASATRQLPDIARGAFAPCPCGFHDGLQWTACRYRSRRLRAMSLRLPQRAATRQLPDIARGGPCWPHYAAA